MCTFFSIPEKFPHWKMLSLSEALNTNGRIVLPEKIDVINVHKIENKNTIIAS